MTLRKSHWLAAACMAALSCTASVQAQDGGSAGIVRISDGRARNPVKAASFHGHHAHQGEYHGGYHGGYTGQGTYGGCPTCDCHGGSHCFHGFFQERYCKNSPDHGYSPPAKYPLHRRGVQYDQYFPHQWYGTPGASYQAAPMVYQPTDTTQLGYSYQHVPFWQPSPGMMPQRPIPAQWHITAPAHHASSFHNGFGGFHNGFGGGDCPMEMSVPASNGQPTSAPTEPAAPTEIKPVPPEVSLPPTPRQFENSAESNHIRRAAFE